MAKIKSKVNLGIKEISKLEVKSSADELSSSFITADNLLHHNCNG
jgi:hypothetical protein